VTRVLIEKLPSGVPGFDDALGGGLPELSFNLIAGGPGCGKTTLAHQILFANASTERTSLYITVVGEPPLKMLRYQQQYSFFDVAKVNECVRFLHLGDVLVQGGLDAVLDAIVHEVERTQPAMVVVDSFKSVVRKSLEEGQMDVGHFVQRLALQLTSWSATTFLVGEYLDPDDSNPLFSVADGIFWLSQSTTGNSVTRKLQVIKMRGQGQISGLHTMAITDAGVVVYPRQVAEAVTARAPTSPQGRLSSGNIVLDEMLGGGIPAGSAMLIAGPSGAGKTTLALQCARAGVAAGESVVLALFERGAGAPTPVGTGTFRVIKLRSLDLSIDAALAEIRRAVDETGARRVVIDSLSGLAIALSAAFRAELQEALYRTISALTRLGVTVVMTTELDAAHQVTPYGISFLTDGIVLLRYREAEGRVQRTVTVLKMRGSDHSPEIRRFEIERDGIVIEPADGGT
jgi:circadian clock protein KaiC